MRVTDHIRFYGARDCKYKWRGQNLTEMRRTKLRQIAIALELDADGTKNDLLAAIIRRADVLEANDELTDA